MGKLNLSSATLPQYSMTLPVCGQVISFRPFVVREEKILLIALQSNNPKQISDAIRNVVLSCTHSVVDTRKIGVAEAEYAFLQIRSKSIGEEVKPQVTCSACGAETNIKIRLDEIEMKKAEKEAGNPIIVISDDVSVVMRYPSIHDADIQSGEVEMAFQLAEQCIESIIVKDEVFAKKDIDTKEISEFIDNLLPEKFALMLNYIKTTPELKYVIKYKCPKCGDWVSVELKTITDFFQ